MGFVGANPNIQNVTANITLPENINFLPFTHENRNPTKERQWLIPSDNVAKTIAGGYFYLEIYNTSLSQIAITCNTVVINIMPGEKWVSEDRLDWQHKKQELGPEIIVKNNTGEGIRAHVCYPNDSPVNPYTF